MIELFSIQAANLLTDVPFTLAIDTVELFFIATMALIELPANDQAVVFIELLFAAELTRILAPMIFIKLFDILAKILLSFP